MTCNKDRLADRLVGLTQIAEVVGVSVPTMRKMARAYVNRLPVTWVCGRWWASREELERWCERQLRKGQQDE